LPINKHARLSTNVSQLIPQSEFGSAALGILATAILSVGITALSAAGLGQYGWGLFVGIPFFLGLNSTLIYGFHQPRTIGKCLLVALLATALVGISLFALAVEGIICLAMAFPLAIVLSLFGGFIGFLLQQRQSFNAQSFRVVSVVFLLMPGLNLLEYKIGNTPPLYAVKTSVIIDATPDKVWTMSYRFAAATTQ
jgi:hypothetical protein